MEKKREIAVDLKVLPPETVVVHLILSVKPAAGTDAAAVLERVEQAMETWFDGHMLGQNLLLAQIAQRIYQVEGVENYQIEGPVNDVTVGEGQLPVLGSLSVEEMW